MQEDVKSLKLYKLNPILVIIFVVTTLSPDVTQIFDICQAGAEHKCCNQHVPGHDLPEPNLTGNPNFVMGYKWWVTIN